MFSVNSCVVGGNLTADPEIRMTKDGTSVSRITLAVNDGKDETDFIDCVLWKQTAEFICKYAHKGDCVLVEGKLKIRDWEDKTGAKRRTAEIRAKNAEIVSKLPAKSDEFKDDAITF